MSKPITIKHFTEQPIAEVKARAVIQSCETIHHFHYAEKYLNLYGKKFKYHPSYISLLQLFKATLKRKNL